MNDSWKKRVAQGTVVALALTTMSTTTVLSQNNKASDLVNGYRTAGIVQAVSTMEAGAYATADVEESQVTVVAAAEEQPQTKNAEWQNRLMANVDEFLYVRAAANAESDIVGKMYQGDVAEVTGTEGDWYQITSGNVNGYVLGEYCVTGEDAYALATQVCKTYAKAKEGGIRIREAASADSSIYTVMAIGDTIEVNTEVEPVDGWVAVSTKQGTGYVSSDYVDVSVDYGTAITIEEEQAAIAAAKAAEEAAKAAEEAAAAKARAVTVQNQAVAASYDDVTILAALIQCEAGNECYDGQVAVGAVVCNRVRSGGYPGSVYGVVYQSGQFTPAARGSVASVAASGPNASCIQAAQAALAGTDNTGGALSFRPTSSGRGGVVIGNHVFF